MPFLVVVPNTYRNENLHYRYTSTPNNSRKYTLPERNSSFVSSGANVNHISNNTINALPRASQYQNQYNTNGSNAVPYATNSSQMQTLGIPQTSSSSPSPYYKTYQGASMASPNRSSSPNLFENKEYGGTVDDIKNRFTNSPTNYKFGQSSTHQQHHPQSYPLLENLKNVSESEIRRNKKG